MLNPQPDGELAKLRSLQRIRALLIEQSSQPENAFW